MNEHGVNESDSLLRLLIERLSIISSYYISLSFQADRTLIVTIATLLPVLGIPVSDD